VEANSDDHTVGLGGYPNLLGRVEVDASIMDGRDLNAGAVGAMRDCLHPISVARQVMECLPHLFLVGQGAERFAAEMGFERCDLLTEEAREVWEERLRADMPAEVFERLADQPELSRWVQMAADPERAVGTVNFIAQDGQGHLCAGASTSGWAWKYPGRLGDTPVIGAGVYADSRYGAVACTGMGEMAIRAGTARSLTLYLKMGLSLAQAGRQAMLDLNDLGGAYLSNMHIVAVDKDGRHAGFSNVEDKTYVYLKDGMRDPEELPRIHVPTRMCWGREGD
jgi:beta-aspartyl-peptidase (threonine type)